MFKPSAFIVLVTLATTAQANFRFDMDTIYMTNFDRVVSKARNFDDNHYVISSYEARILGDATYGSSHLGEKVHVNFQIVNEFYGNAYQYASEDSRAVAAESCLNMANQLRLSGNTELALKMMVPKHSGQFNAGTNTRTYTVSHSGDKNVADLHMQFECELTKKPSRTSVIDGGSGIISK